MARINPLIPLVDIQQQEPTGDRLITFGTITGGTPYATYANLFALECLLQDLDGSAVYQIVDSCYPSDVIGLALQQVQVTPR